MSYNTRRSGGNQNYNNGMGGRGRPGLQQNFVSSGQYQQSQKPGGVTNIRPQQQRQGGPQRATTPMQRPVTPQQQQQQRQQTPQQQIRPQQQQQPPQPLRQPHAPLPPPPLKSALKKEAKNEPAASPQPQQTNTPQQQTNTPVTAPVQQVTASPQQLTPKPPQVTAPPQQLTPKPLVTAPPQIVTQQSPAQQLNVQPANAPQTNAPQTNAQQTNAVAQQPKPPVLMQAPAVPPTLNPKQEMMETENGEVKKKTLILKGKISKKEKRGRRNRRLRKILVPKNALMVLNELVGGHKFSFLDKDPSQPNFYIEPDTYIASVTIEGTDHVGYGKSKTAAKTSAAENALRHIILSKIASPLGPAQSLQSVDTEVDQSMEVDGEKQEEEDVSWLHVASFAMHKLFSSWYAEGDDKLEQAKLLARSAGVTDMTQKLQEIKPFPGPPKTRKPAKQLPQNPQLLNPVMLLNQMRDDVVYEEHSKIGTAPHIVFVIKTTVDGIDFFGRGANKKVARKNCAFAACIKLYGITYPVEEFDPTSASEGQPMF